MIHYELDKEYAKRYYAKKYSKWMALSPNKWHPFQLDEYEKLILIDVDILPIHPELYTLFECKVPCITGSRGKTPTVRFKTYEQFLQNSLAENITLDGGLIVVTPSKQLHKGYFNFLEQKFRKTGIKAISISGPDETTLLYYLYHHLKLNATFYDHDKYIKIAWHKPKKQTYSLNYLSFIKPWKKPMIFMWAEEYIWSHLLNKIILDNMHEDWARTMLFLWIRDQLDVFYYLIDDPIHEKEQESLNHEYLKQPKIKEILLIFLKLLKKDSGLRKLVSTPHLNLKNKNSQEELFWYGNVLKMLDNLVLYPDDTGKIDPDTIRLNY